jgi:hypothetical protein
MLVFYACSDFLFPCLHFFYKAQTCTNTHTYVCTYITVMISTYKEFRLRKTFRSNCITREAPVLVEPKSLLSLILLSTTEYNPEVFLYACDPQSLFSKDLIIVLSSHLILTLLNGRFPATIMYIFRIFYILISLFTSFLGVL